MCGIRRVNIVRKSLIREVCKCEGIALERVEMNVLKLFEHA